MSQNEKQPENKQDQVNAESTEQKINEQETSTEDASIVQNEQDTSEQHTNEQDANAQNGNEQVESTDETDHSVQPFATHAQTNSEINNSSKSTGWKVATGILAAAVVGLLIYTFIPKAASGDILAKVNGDKITQADLLDKVITQNYDYVSELVEAIIDEKVVDQELKAKNLTVTEADLDAELSAFRLRYPDENDFLSLLSYYGMTEEDLKNNLKQSSQIRLLLGDSITITDEQIQEYFDTNYESLGAHGERVRASHILVTDEDLAKDIISQLDQGADFAALATQYGTDGTAQVGGDLGYFEFEGMIPEFATAAFALEVNTYSKEPVSSTYGYHVILKTDEQAPYEPALENLKDAIKIELTNTEIYSKHANYIDDLRTKGNIENTFSTVYPGKTETSTDTPVIQ